MPELNLQYELGKLHGRVDSLETRADQQEKTLISMDGKLDVVLTQLAERDGGQAQMASLTKYGVGILAAVGSVGLAVIELFHYLTGRG